MRAPLQRPNEYLADFIDELQTHLYKRPQQLLNDKKAELIARNSKLWGNSQTSAQHLGMFYFSEKSNRMTEIPNPIRQELLDEWRSYLKQVDDLVREQQIVMGYVRKLLLRTQCLEDIKAMLPDNIPWKNFLSQVGFPMDMPSLNQEQRDCFVTENKRYLDAMRVRMVDNLIIGG